ncbi:MAG: DUF4153 domain-containing protein [Tannerella sp.]|jgi:hypothetical protein|nr:DUF4153 domain-containing protein [Tannerella sp.]
MKSNHFFASLKQAAGSLLHRFPFPLLAVLGFSFLCFRQALLPSDSDEQLFCCWVFFGLGFPLSLAATLWFETLKRRKLKTVLAVLLCIAWLLYAFYLYAGTEFPRYLDMDQRDTYFSPELLAIGLCSTLAVFFLPYLGKRADDAFWRFARQVITQFLCASFFGLVLLAGLLIALLSIENLFDLQVHGWMYADLYIFSLALFAPLYFLAHIPSGTAEVAPPTMDRWLKVLGMYILAPLVGLYTLIMYAYLLRSLVGWELPRGWVSFLVSLLMLGGLTVIAILYPLPAGGKPRFWPVLSRYFGLLALPLLLLMTVGILRRFSDYGMTANRCYVLSLNLWFYGVGLYLYLTRARKLKWIVCSFALLFFLTSVGPWSFTRLAERAREKRLEAPVKAPKEEPAAAAEQSRPEKPEKKVDYLSFAFQLEDAQILRIQGYEAFVSMDFSSGDSTHYRLQKGMLCLKDSLGRTVFTLPVKQIALKLQQRGDENRDGLVRGKRYLFFIKNLSAAYYPQSDSLDLQYLEGYLFYKRKP